MVSNISINNLLQLLPNSNTPSNQGYGQKLANLVKIYTDEAKYNSNNNSFLFKLTIFHDICARVDISQDILLKTFSTILTGLILDYYYSNISISIAATFEEVCDSIQTYFERAEYKKSVLFKWSMITFKCIIEKNGGKSIEKCF